MTSARTLRTAKKGNWKRIFLDVLSTTGIVLSACRAASIGRTTAYAARGKDARFAASWDEALDEAADRLEQEAWRRAYKGVKKPVFGSLGYRKGSGQIGSIREYSDTLMIFLLKGARPQKFRDVAHGLNINITPEQLLQMSDDDLDTLIAKLTPARAR